MSLLKTYPPHKDESGFGYYRRLAADNVLSGWRELAGYAGLPKTRSALLSHVELVAGELGLEREWARSASRQELQCRSWGRLQRGQTDAVCPACMAEEQPYLRNVWSHAYVTACPRHRVVLVDRCDACGSRLSPNRDRIDRCECGQHFQHLPRVASTPAQHWLSSLIAGDGRRNGGGIAPDVRGADLTALASLMGTLCLSADPTHMTLHRSAALPKSVVDAIEFLAPLEVLLADWPAGFRTHVEARIAAGNQEARTLNKLLGPWYIELRKRCQGTALEPFLKVVIEVAAERFEGVLGLDSAKALAQDVTDYVLSAEAAKTIGVSVSCLHKALKEGQCAYRERRFGTRGVAYEIAREEVRRIQQQRSEWVSDERACELAGVSPAVLAHMMAAGVIESDVNWRHDLLKGGPVKAASIEALLERLRVAAVPVAVSAEDETLTWAGLTSRRMGDKLAIQSAMQAASDGQLKAVVVGRCLGEMVFRRDEVSEYFGTPLLEAGMSIQQLSRTTGWKWESISHWIQSGLLESESIMLRGKPCRVVLPHQLLAFRQAYVSLADLARAMGTKSSGLSKRLSGIELVGAQQLPGGAMRGGLIPMHELGRLALIGARAGQDLFVQNLPDE